MFSMKYEICPAYVGIWEGVLVCRDNVKIAQDSSYCRVQAYTGVHRWVSQLSQMQNTLRKERDLNCFTCRYDFCSVHRYHFLRTTVFLHIFRHIFFPNHLVRNLGWYFNEESWIFVIRHTLVLNFSSSSDAWMSQSVNFSSSICQFCNMGKIHITLLVCFLICKMYVKLPKIGLMSKYMQNH